MEFEQALRAAIQRRPWRQAELLACRRRRCGRPLQAHAQGWQTNQPLCEVLIGFWQLVYDRQKRIDRGQTSRVGMPPSRDLNWREPASGNREREWIHADVGKEQQ